MKIAVVGLGKLGLPIALAIDSRGYDVWGYDINPQIAEYLSGDREYPYQEKDLEHWLGRSTLKFKSLDKVCWKADIIFLIPQTPHRPEFDGTHPRMSSPSLSPDCEDFDYSFLVQCVKDVDRCLTRNTICVVVSTVLPGTIEREILPVVSSRFLPVYSPQFAAMGTVIPDFLAPEFFLMGADYSTNGKESTHKLREFYHELKRSAKIIRTDIRTAEAIKVLYNTYVTMKTVFANMYGELAERMNLDADAIYSALLWSKKRLLSQRYLQAGMGDGGACHPRDNIAMSWLARKTEMSYDFFGTLMGMREKHARWIAETAMNAVANTGLPLFILGKAFKADSTIMDGSPAILVSNILKQNDMPHEIVEDMPLHRPGVYLIGCKHSRYKRLRFWIGSVVIDPFRYLPDMPGVKVVRLGERREGIVEPPSRGDLPPSLDGCGQNSVESVPNGTTVAEHGVQARTNTMVATGDRRSDSAVAVD